MTRTNRLHSTVSGLVDWFNSRKPVRTGNLIATFFGDIAMPRGGCLATQNLLDVMGLVGIGDGLVRTSLSRLSAENMFNRTRTGRKSFYALSENAWAEYEQASAVIYSPLPEAWNAHWLVIMLIDVPSGGLDMASPERSAKENTPALEPESDLRKSLKQLGFARFGAQILIRPSNFPPKMRQHLDRLLDDASILLIEGQGGVIPTGFKALTDQIWDVSALQQAYEDFTRRYDPIAALLEKGAEITPEEALMIRLLMIHEYRAIVLKDPMLPPDILPAHWSGSKARQLCRDIYAQVFELSESWVSAHCYTETGPLPPPNGLLYERFGGFVG